MKQNRMHQFKDPTDYYRSDVVANRYAKSSFHLLHGEETFLREYFTDGMSGIRALDLGCGGGRISHYLSQMGANVIACDISLNLVEVAQDRIPSLKATLSDGANLCFENECFDLIVFSYNGLDYLSPIAQRQKALEEVIKTLKRGGLFLFSSHSFGGMSFGIYRHWRKPKAFVKASLFALQHICSGHLSHPELFIPDIIDGVTTYYAWPEKVLADCQRTGFEVVTVFSNSQHLNYVQKVLQTNFLTLLFEPWPYYVCRKPR